jgi:AcrR family transcriptional regulator
MVNKPDATSPASRPRKPVKRRSPGDRKHQILTCAAVLFVERGFLDVTMSQIADQVGITAGALYRHFDSKSAILAAILVDWFDKSIPSSEGSDSLDSLLMTRASIATSLPGLGVLWSRESRHLQEDVHEQLAQRLRSVHAAYRSSLRKERPDLSDEDLSIVSWAMQSILSSTSTRPSSLSPHQLAGLLFSASLAVARLTFGPEAASTPHKGIGLLPNSKREAALVVASLLFGERGYQATSMADIGAFTNVTGPSLYTHFASKAEILNEVLERSNRALWQDLTDALQISPSAAAALDRIILSYVGLVRSRPYVLSSLVSGSDVKESIQSSEREYVHEWVALLLIMRPNLTLAQAKVLVRAALNVINNFALTPKIAVTPNFSEKSLAVARAILYASP